MLPGPTSYADEGRFRIWRQLGKHDRNCRARARGDGAGDEHDPGPRTSWHGAAVYAGILPLDHYCCTSCAFCLAEMRSGWLVIRGSAFPVLAAGFLGMFICGGPVYIAGMTTTAINIALIMSLSPIVVLLLSWVLGLERIGALQLLGTGLALIGALLIVTRRHSNSGSYQGCNRRTGAAGRAQAILARKSRGPTRVKSGLGGSQVVEGNSLPNSDRCRAQGSLRGRLARLRMGFVEKMPHWLPRVQGPRRSLRGQSARRPGRDAFRWRGSSIVGVQADSGSAHTNSVPSRQMACRMTASLRATAMEARFQPMRLASRSAHIFSGQGRRTRVMSTPAASYK
jgi:hypothetical protein